MLRSRVLTVGFLLVAISTIPKPVTADPVRIESGYLTIGGVQDVTARGFLRTVQYDFSTSDYRLRWLDVDTVPQDVFAPTLPHVSLWTVAGQPETLVFLNSDLSINASPDLLSSPFFLSGRLGIIDMATGAMLRDQLISGSGTASWQFLTNPAGGRTLSGATYVFSDVAPTPEPTTVLLLGLGLAGLAIRRRT